MSLTSDAVESSEPTLERFVQWLQQIGLSEAHLQPASGFVTKVGGVPLLEVVPAVDPQHVRELSGVLLGCYQFADGRFELAGCTLDPRPFLRLSLTDQSDRLRHFWFGSDGQECQTEFVRRLGLNNLVQTERRLRAAEEGRLQQWVNVGLSQVQSLLAASAHGPGKLIAATIVWCRWSEGTIVFLVRDRVVCRLRFSGWASDFLNGHQSPPPYQCLESGCTGYDLTLLEDGTLTTVEATAVCAQSGQKTLACRLERCFLTGKSVLASYLSRCPILGEKMLPDLMQRCGWCQRLVCPGSLENQLCSDCRTEQRVDVTVAPWRDMMASFPQADRYGAWVGWKDDSQAVLRGRRWSGEIALQASLPEVNLLKVWRRFRFRRRWGELQVD